MRGLFDMGVRKATIWGIVVVAGAVILTGSAQAQVICPGEQPCPAGYHETAVNCKVCVVDGYDLTRPTDTDACPIGSWITLDQKHCCPDSTILKSDGMCCVVNETDPCTCMAGWHQVAAFTCCPDGMEISTDNTNCCKVGVGPCCAEWQQWDDWNGVCAPKKPQNVVVR
jgi:hypothetical protein